VRYTRRWVLAMNRRLKYPNNHGYTLIEIVVVIVVLGIISGVTFQIVASGVEVFKKSSGRKELSDQGRLALDRMVRELRDAKEITATSGDSITFKKAHPSAQDSAEEIKFQLNGANLERIADPSGSSITSVLAANVSSFTVTQEGATGGEGEGGLCSIGYDSASSATNGNVGSLTFSHAIGSGANRLLVVGVAIEECGTSRTVSGITYNTQALTKITSAEVISGSGCRSRAELWYLLEADLPSAGSYSVVVTASGSCDDLTAGSISLTDVAQQGPESSATNTNENQNTISTNITTSTDGAWIVDVAHCGNDSSFTANANQSERWDRTAWSSDGAGSTKLVASAGTTTMGWTNYGANRLSHAAAAFAPDTGCAGAGSAGNLVMVVGSTSPLVSDDQAKKILFESWGWTVSVLNDDTADYSTAAANNDVMFISDSVTSGAVNTKALNLDIGVVVEEEALSDDMEFSSYQDTNGLYASQVYVNDNSHYITDSFSTGNLTIYSQSDDVYVVEATLGSGAQVLAQQAGGGDPCLYVFDTGAQLASGSAVNRRVGFHCTHHSDPDYWNTNIETLLRRSFEWAAGASEQENLVTLEILLEDPNDSNSQVRMRTKVHLRNMQ